MKNKTLTIFLTLIALQAHFQQCESALGNIYSLLANAETIYCDPATVAVSTFTTSAIPECKSSEFQNDLT